MHRLIAVNKTKDIPSPYRCNPDNFAFILRVGGVSFIALIGHSHCRMVNLASRKGLFIQGLMKRAVAPMLYRMEDNRLYLLKER